MKTRTIITIIFLVFVAASVGYLILNETRGVEQRAADDPAAVDNPPAAEGLAAVDNPAEAGTADIVIVYYFHGDKRCRTCLSIEAYTKESIESSFPEQLESGELELRIVNVDEPENEHFIHDYGLTTKSVILADYRGGAQERWKNLGMIWEYVRDKETFIGYVRRETEEFLGESLYE
jgi:hypothetical protein